MPRFRDVGRGRHLSPTAAVLSDSLVCCRVESRPTGDTSLVIGLLLLNADISGCCRGLSGKNLLFAEFLRFLSERRPLHACKTQRLRRNRYRDHVTMVLYVIANIRFVLVRSVVRSFAALNPRGLSVNPIFVKRPARGRVTRRLVSKRMTINNEHARDRVYQWNNIMNS